MKLSLLVLTSGKQQGKMLEIKLPQFLVGRDPQCHLRPASPLISKRHCAILQRDGKVFVRDFGSTNGTLVNDERVEGERELHHDDQLKIGPIQFTIRIETEVSASARSTPAPATRSATTRTPAPATRPAAAPAAAAAAPEATLDPTPAPGKGSESEDDIAAILLSLEGDDSSAGVSIPEGTTVFDIPAQPGQSGEKQGDKAAQDKNKKQGTGDTRTAAASILEKMMKRPRS
jgi:pSer/pThr/pTyr-binding forkhead associated (FHA) protein